ncbi:DUF6461 domain-containing protein [Streptomyces sp. NPDC012623]|uniref:DUF6461 domain-containing protein n=1 Tax=unclassified Streptomyces TaxID=2593676 RepID=UPI0036B67DE2
MVVTPVADSWRRIDSWLAAHAPRTFGSLRPPAPQEAISAAAAELGVVFPADLVASLRHHDGVSPESSRPSGDGSFKFPGYDLLTLAAMLSRGRMHHELWGREGEDLPFEGYWHPQYVTLADNCRTDALVVDCRQGDSTGAIGLHLKSEGTRFGQLPSLAALLEKLADCLEYGRVLELDGRHVAAVDDGKLLWARAPESRPAPRSVLDLAATLPPPPTRPAWEYGTFCLTLVQGIDQGELLRRYGALPATRRPRTREQALAEAHVDTSLHRAELLPVVRVGSCGAWVFGIEEGHREGNRHEVLRRLSRGTRAVAVHFVNSTTMTLYENGRRVTAYDSGRVRQLEADQDPFTLIPGLPPHDGSTVRWIADTGVLTPPGRSAHPTPEQQRTRLLEITDAIAAHFDISPPPDTLAGALDSAQLLPVVGDSGWPAPLTHAFAPLVAAPPERLRRILASQMGSLAAETGLDTYPEVNGVLPQVGREVRPGFEEDSALGLRIRRVLAEAEVARGTLRDADNRPLITSTEALSWRDRADAARALVDALTRPPADALGRVLHQRQDPHWRAELRAQLKEY